MKLRLHNLETKLRALEEAVTVNKRLAQSLQRTWRYELSQGLSPDEEYRRMKLARGIHAANPDVWPEVEELLREEAQYMKRRAAEYIADLEPAERNILSRLLRGDAAG